MRWEDFEPGDTVKSKISLGWMDFGLIYKIHHIDLKLNYIEIWFDKKGWERLHMFNVSYDSNINYYFDIIELNNNDN